MQWPPTGTFEIQTRLISNEPAYRNDKDKKRLFGILLRELEPLEAALKLFSEDTAAALWVSQNWINDPEVLQGAEKEEKDLKFLDKEHVAGKALSFFDEKDASGRFYINDGSDRLKALELYAKIAGYLKNNENGANINFDNRTMNIKLVSPEKQETKLEPKVINQNSDNVVPMNIKLVS